MIQKIETNGAGDKKGKDSLAKEAKESLSKEVVEIAKKVGEQFCKKMQLSIEDGVGKSGSGRSGNVELHIGVRDVEKSVFEVQIWFERDGSPAVDEKWFRGIVLSVPRAHYEATFKEEVDSRTTLYIAQFRVLEI